jgi:hypothetical protein
MKSRGKISPVGVPWANVDVKNMINSKQRQTIMAVTTIETIEINRFNFLLPCISIADIIGLSP